jgi:sugar phosphate isomerase/epimerase
MINFGIRQSFDNIEQIQERYSALKSPIELALPYHWDIYEPIRVHLPEIVQKIKSYGTEVLSIHSVQAPITDDRFRLWGKEIVDFARALKVKNITLHPNNVNDKVKAQGEARKNLKYFSGLYSDEITFCIETFEGKKRVFNPAETAAYNLPMTLDTSHVKNQKEVWNLLENYRHNILGVHLSAREQGKQHLPIDSFCKEVVGYLAGNNWDGNVILEYIFEFHDRMLDDLEILRAVH